MNEGDEALIVALDVGTTSVRCFIFNEKCEIKGSAVELVDLLSPQPGYFEIEPEALWNKIVQVIKTAVQDAQLLPTQLNTIKCIGLSTQRCTFLTWDPRKQEYFHNFITWKDLRANTDVDVWNASYALKTIKTISYALYLLTRSKRFLAGSVLKMMNGQVTLRLLHEIRNNKRLQQAIKDKRARVEFLDSWIIYKLRSGNEYCANVEHITDITSATATGLFDPFTLTWSPMVKYVFGIDISLLPQIVHNGYNNFGSVNAAALGFEWKNTNIPIVSSISDQTAAMWGSYCFEGGVKITMGTGAFLDFITGKNCQASLKGLYPLVAWQFIKNDYNSNESPRAETVFCMEGAVHDMGTVITWAQNCGLFNDATETSDIAESVEDTNEVYFVPAFSGLGAPINDYKAGTGFIGITPSTRRAHLVRAILESIVFRLVQLCETAEKETNCKLTLLKVDGGVSRNNFVCQFLADASGIRVERAQNSESSIMGATYMAGYNAGIWDLNTILTFRKVDRIFVPRTKEAFNIKTRMKTWLKATSNFGNWY